MELLANGLRLEIPAGVFPLSTDSILLANFVQPRPGERILDLGSGCGTLGMLLCAKNDSCIVCGIELDQTAHDAALENIQSNALAPRLSSICADIKEVNQIIPSGSFHRCISNPPYFSGGPASKATPLARREDSCTPEDLFRGAAWALRYGGDFYLVHKPERLAQLCGCAINAGLEPKRLRLVRHRPGDEVSLILLQCRKGGKPGLIWEEVTLFEADGTPTPFYKSMYHSN